MMLDLYPCCVPWFYVGSMLVKCLLMILLVDCNLIHLVPTFETSKYKSQLTKDIWWLPTKDNFHLLVVIAQ